MHHPDQQRLLRHLRGELGESDAGEVFAHVAECSSCHRRYEALRALRDDFEAGWEKLLSGFAGRQDEPRAILCLAGHVLDGPRRALVALRRAVGWDGLTAVPAVSAAGVGDPGRPGAVASEMEIRVAEKVVGRVVVDAGRRSLSLLLEPEILARSALLRFPSGLEVSLRPEEVAGASYRLAEATDLPDGSFDLVLDLVREGR